jgi:putative ABC transport system permease protein
MTMSAALPRLPPAFCAVFDADSWSEIWATMRRNKLRAFLTACGVFWGIFMLVIMLGIGTGLRRGTARNLGGLALLTVYVWGQRTTLPHAGLRPGRSINFTNADTAALSAVPGVLRVEPRIRLGEWRVGVNVSSGAKTQTFNVVGATSALLSVEPLLVPRGRFLDELDLDEQRKVAIVGDQVRRTFFGDDDPVGRDLRVQGIHFRVIGALKSLKSGDEGERIDGSVFVPFSTFQTAFHMRDRVHWFALAVEPTASAVEVEKRARQTLSRQHRIAAADDQALGSYNAAEEVARIEGLFRGIRIFVWFVGTLTLLAGVLGVSNILLIIVKERTKEIGIRKALGATPASIVMLVIEESLALTALAGYAGLVAGVGFLELLAKAVATMPKAPMSEPEVDLKAALFAVAILMLAGVVAGIVPARHAAGIHPVEALRAE